MELKKNSYNSFKPSYIGLCSFVFVVSLFFTSQTSLAKQYIRDDLKVDIRAGAGNQYKILKFIKTGTPLEQLEQGEGEQADWVKVNIAGIEGWVLKQHLSKNPGSAQKLSEALTDIEKLVEENKALKEKLATLSVEAGDKAAAISKAQELEKICESEIKLTEAYKKNQIQLTQIDNENESLKNQNNLLKEDNFAEGLKWGIAAILIGALFGWLFKSSQSKKSSW